MKCKSLLCPLLVVVALAMIPGRLFAMGEILGETKDELKLKYDVVISDPGNGQIMVKFTLIDDGRLKPIDGVSLAIPKADGSGSYDLSVPLALRGSNGEREARFELKKEWAARAEIWLNTYWFDGKKLVMTHDHHIIPIATYLKPPTPAAPAPKAQSKP